MGAIISHESRGASFSDPHFTRNHPMDKSPKSKSMSDLSLLHKRNPKGPARDSLELDVEEREGGRGKAVHRELAELEEVTSAQVQSLRREFEEVSAPNAFMSFATLNKFQTRMIRRKGESFYRKLAGISPLLRSPKPSEKDIRALARKLCVRVFKHYRLWDEDEDEPGGDAVVTFEQYLAVVYKMKIKEEKHPSCASQSKSGSKSILKAGWKEEAKGGEGKDVQLRRAVEFQDHPSEEVMDEEWKLKMMTSTRLRDEGQRCGVAGRWKMMMKNGEREKRNEKGMEQGHSGDEEEGTGRRAEVKDLDSKAEEDQGVHSKLELVFELSEEEVHCKLEVMKDIKMSIERELERQQNESKEGKQTLHMK
ncbi:hypothetical protein GUITHDRAFT_101741 [Guillardia theta CCMP2712]|uniref:Uncharacterized protein n=1 Tax=Guillardia theta (strain CCMP2712) TaxID=905079 RepID=L1JW56_GUITC|nr:hypothetical protein GUITHDRAFT_101741 [Guillardia theta CCMP2712]EKX52574.1 hypothetical protein GUITHDRAFT_101741 [Guillardia theta CCMP2712]|eukprot:XP_005839554.1 hypothetical protein GUITHDRAFT_101741 [Guillardia theta CCMP2712]